MTKSAIHYVTDDAGSPVAVQVPIADWNLFQKEFDEMKRALEILHGIKNALEEVEQVKQGKRKLQTLSDFLHEC
ncbi:MAG: hypothetical protein KAX50_10665 [Saprospiraceae bacterium]|jgi:hypothetical protein|nr:hypothetical protein [Saprospiraceae bacterium]